MGCCGQVDVAPKVPEGQKQPGDILVQALWSGNHVKRGLATGRRYPRMSYPRTAWIAQADAQADARNWKIVKTAPIQPNGQPKTKWNGVEGFAKAVIDAGMVNPPAPVMPEWEETENLPANYKLLNGDKIPAFDVPQEDIAPDWARLVELGAQRYAD